MAHIARSLTQGPNEIPLADAWTELTTPDPAHPNHSKTKGFFVWSSGLNWNDTGDKFTELLRITLTPFVEESPYRLCWINGAETQTTSLGEKYAHVTFLGLDYDVFQDYWRFIAKPHPLPPDPDAPPHEPPMTFLMKNDYFFVTLFTNPVVIPLGQTIQFARLREADDPTRGFKTTADFHVFNPLTRRYVQAKTWDNGFLDLATGTIRFPNPWKASRDFLEYLRCGINYGQVQSDSQVLWQTFALLDADNGLDLEINYNEADDAKCSFKVVQSECLSYLKLRTGHRVQLRPQTLSFVLRPFPTKFAGNRPTATNFQLSPEGKCQVSGSNPTIPGAPQPRHLVLGGNGGESAVVSLNGTTTLEFVTNQPAELPAGPKQPLAGRLQTSYLRIPPTTYFAFPDRSPNFTGEKPSPTEPYPFRDIAVGQGDVKPIPTIPYAGLNGKRREPDGRITSDGLVYRDIDIDAMFLSPARRRLIEVNAQPLALLGTEKTTTPFGVILTREAGQLSVDLATPNESPTSGLSLSVSGPQAKKAMQAFADNQLILVASALRDFAQLKRNRIELDKFNMEIGVNGGGSTIASQMPTTLIIKYHPRKALSLLEAPSQWALARDLNVNEDNTSRQLQQFYDASTDGIFDSFRERLNRPSWNGSVALNATIDIADLPKVLAALEPGMGGAKQILAHHVGVEYNKIDTENLKQVESDFFAVVRYEAPAGPSGYSAGGPFKFKVQKIEAVFEKSRLARFTSTVLVKPAKLFDDELQDLAEEEALTLFGAYKMKDGVEVFDFSTREGFSQTFPFKTSSVFESITIAGASFSVGDSEGDLQTARFLLKGALKFRDDLSIGDLFSFKDLGFQGLGLEYEFASGDPTRFKPIINLEKFSVSVGSQIRSSSLADGLGLRFTGVHLGVAPSSLEDLGYKPLSFESAAPSAVKYGLTFESVLSSLGALDELKGLSLGIMVGWSQGKKYAVGLRIPSIAGGPRSVGVNGVFRISYNNLLLGRSQQKKGYFILLEQAKMEVLGTQWPPGGSTITLMLMKPADLPELAWFVVWPGKANPTGSVGPFALEAFAVGRYCPKSVMNANTLDQAFDELRNIASELPVSDPATLADSVLDLCVSDSGWLVGADMHLAGLELGFLFLDRKFYALKVKFSVVDVQIAYRRLSRTVGVYSTEFGLPPAIKSIQLGIGSLDLPKIGLSVYTNGDFEVDIGFPNNDDYTRSCVLQAGVFIGFGGIKVAKLSDLTNLHPVGPNLSAQAGQTYVVASLAVRVGLGRQIEMGLLRAGVSITVFGILAGRLGYDNEHFDPFSPKSVQMGGRIGIIGELYGYVDFVVVKAGVAIKVEIYVDIQQKEPNASIPVSLNAEVAASAEIVIGTIRVFRKTIKLTVEHKFNARFRYETTLGGSTGLLSAPSSSTLAPLALPPAAIKPRLELRCGTVVTLDDSRQPVAVPLAWIGKMHATALVSALTRLLLEPFGGDITQANLQALYETSRSRPRGEPVQTYDQIVTFLKEQFDLVLGMPNNDGDSENAVILPWLPHLSLEWSSGRRDFRHPAPFDYREAMSDMFEQSVPHRSSGDPPSFAAPPDNKPIAEIAFEDFFSAICRAIVEELYRFGTDSNGASHPKEDLVNRFSQPRTTGGPNTIGFELVSFASRLMQQGLRIASPDEIPEPQGRRKKTSALCAVNASNGSQVYGQQIRFTEVGAKAVYLIATDGWPVVPSDPLFVIDEPDNVPSFQEPQLTVEKLPDGVPTTDKARPFVFQKTFGFGAAGHEQSFLVPPLRFLEEYPAGQVLTSAPPRWGLPVRFGLKSADSALELKPTSLTNIDALDSVIGGPAPAGAALAYLLAAADQNWKEIPAADVRLVRTNLSTLLNPIGGFRVDGDHDIVEGSNVSGVLELLRECAMTNSGGYFVFLKNSPVPTPTHFLCLLSWTGSTTFPVYPDAGVLEEGTRAEFTVRFDKLEYMLKHPPGHLILRATTTVPSELNAHGEPDLHNNFNLLECAHESLNENQVLPIPPNVAAGKWEYIQSVPLNQLGFGNYGAVGSSLKFKLGLRDIFGNRLKLTNQPEFLTPILKYFDPILGPYSWPSLKIGYRFNNGKLEFSAVHEPVLGEDSQKADAKKKLELALEQMSDARIKISVTHARSRGAQDVSSSIIGLLKGALEIFDDPRTLLLEGFSLTPQLQTQLPKFFEWSVHLDIQRDENLVDAEAAAKNPAVKSISANVALKQDLQEFASQFESSLASLKVAAFDSKAGLVYLVSRSLLIGAATTNGISFATTRPLSTSLWSGISATKQVVHDFELDQGMALVFDKVETQLSPKVLATLISENSELYQRLLTAKRSLASAFSGRSEVIFADDHLLDGEPAALKEYQKQILLQDLRRGYHDSATVLLRTHASVEREDHIDEMLGELVLTPGGRFPCRLQFPQNLAVAYVELDRKLPGGVLSTHPSFVLQFIRIRLASGAQRFLRILQPLSVTGTPDINIPVVVREYPRKQVFISHEGRNLTPGPVLTVDNWRQMKRWVYVAKCEKQEQQDKIRIAFSEPARSNLAGIEVLAGLLYDFVGTYGPTKVPASNSADLDTFVKKIVEISSALNSVSFRRLSDGQVINENAEFEFNDIFTNNNVKPSVWCTRNEKLGERTVNSAFVYTTPRESPKEPLLYQSQFPQRIVGANSNIHRSFSNHVAEVLSLIVNERGPTIFEITCSSLAPLVGSKVPQSSERDVKNPGLEDFIFFQPAIELANQRAIEALATGLQSCYLRWVSQERPDQTRGIACEIRLSMRLFSTSFPQMSVLNIQDYRIPTDSILPQ